MNFEILSIRRVAFTYNKITKAYFEYHHNYDPQLGIIMLCQLTTLKAICKGRGDVSVCRGIVKDL